MPLNDPGTNANSTEIRRKLCRPKFERHLVPVQLGEVAELDEIAQGGVAVFILKL